jgi:tetratricopeptide (TPR) repeat protein
MAAANPSVMSYRRAQAEGLLELGYVLMGLRRDPEALDAYRRATDAAEALLAEEPGAAYTLNLLAQSLTRRGDLLVRMGKPAEALPLARRAVETLEPIVRDQPTKIFHTSALGIALRIRGRAEAASGQAAEALQTWERAGVVDGSLADRYPEARYSQGCDFALMIEAAPPERREALAKQAVETLRQAFAAGYSNWQLVKTDDDLAPLRDRADFQALLAGQAARPGKGK